MRERAPVPRPAGFFVLRSPLLGADEYVETDPLDAMNNPIVHEAIARTSPSLAAMVADPDKATPAARLAIGRYLARMRRRATPFSLIAGYSVGTAGGVSVPIRLSARESWRRIVRVDVDCATAIVQCSLADRDLRERAQWLRRSDLGILPDVVRVAVRDTHNRESVVFTDVVRNAALDSALRAAERPASFEQLVEGLRQYTADPAQARSYIHALIERGLLIPAALPSIAADDVLATLPDGYGKLSQAARKIFSTRLDQNIDRPIQRLTGMLAEAQQSDRSDNLIFDLLKPIESGVIGDDILAELGTIVRVLQRTTVAKRDLRLAELGSKFHERYQMREVPLVEALDEHRGFTFPIKPRYDEAGNELKRWLFSLFERACRERSSEIVLGNADLPTAELWQPSQSFSMMFKLQSDPLCIFEPALDASPGTSGFARAAAFDPQVKDAAQAMMRELESRQSEADVAEIVHFLPGKFAAVGQIPKLASFELSLAARPADVATSIDVNDLLLSYAGNGRFEIRSRRTGRRIMPLATGAAHLDRPDTTSLGRFLGAIGRPREMGTRWHWAGLENSSWLPRVRYGDHVLQSQMWRLRQPDTAKLLAAKTGAQRRDAVAALRRDHSLPRHVSYREQGDQWLAVDLEDDWSVAAWLDIAKGEMRLSEQFPVDRSAVNGPNGTFHHELIVPFLTPTAAIARDTRSDGDTWVGDRSAAGRAADINQTFDRVMPGKDVLFLNLTGDRSELLSILSELYRTLIEPAVAAGNLNRWFFLPYSQPDHHIRLRCFGRPAFLNELMSACRAVLQPYVEDRILSSVSLETYDREVHRYGGAHGLKLLERCFQESSAFAIAFHDRHDLQRDAISTLILPWVGSLRAILSATGLALEEQRDIALRAARLYHRPIQESEWDEPHVPRRPEHRAGDAYREVKNAIHQSQLSPECQQFRNRLRPLFRLVRRGVGSGRITRSFDGLLIDFLHVHTLRLLTTWAGDGQVEEVGYHVLARVLTKELHLKTVPSPRSAMVRRAD